VGPSPKVVARTRPFVVRKPAHTVNSDRARPGPAFPCELRLQNPNVMSMSSTDKGLLTPDNCAVIFIDHQPEMFFGGTNTDWEALLKSVLVLAKAAKVFGVPVILTAVQSGEFKGRLAPQLLALFPDQPILQGSSMNAWDDQRFVAAVRKTGRRNFLMAGLWSEACLAFPALQMLEEGYGVYVVKDASRGTNPVAQDTALRRFEQAGGVSVTALQVLLEFQRDWARREHYEEVAAIVRESCGGYRRGAERLAVRTHTARAGGHRKESQRTVKRKEINA
jgi:nicotinamidase-related amidase